MEFKCKRKNELGVTDTWLGTLEFVDVTASTVEVIIQGRGSALRVIFGRTSTGNFVCIPELEVGCSLASWSDHFWNYERLSRVMNPVDAMTVVVGIETVMMTKGRDNGCIHNC